MKKYFNYLLLLLIPLCFACTSEEKSIRKSLQSSIIESDKNNYQYVSHVLLETLLKSNITDTISSLKAEIFTNESLMQMDSARLSEIQSNIDECKALRANTMFFLRSTYDGIISDYNKMKVDIEENINNRLNIIALCEEKVDFLSKAMYEAESPIVFYKVKHSYKMRGAYKDTIVFMNDKYEIVK